MEDSSGFYRYNDILLFAPNFVEGQTFAIYRDSKDSYVYPVEGWYWFDSEQEAKTFFDIPTEDSGSGAPNPFDIIFPPPVNLY